MIVKTVDIKKNFGKKEILKGISLEIKKGDIFGIVGPDGAGKTTFMRTVLGLYLPTSGSIELFCEKEKIGYVAQQFSLNIDMTVWENIIFFAKLNNIPDDILKPRVEKLLKMVWLDKFKDRLAGALSGGMKQKLALIISVIHSPDLLILDEPTTGVDPVSRREFWQMLYYLNRDGLTIIVSTPYMDEVELCTNISFFNAGKAIATGTTDELLSKYPHKIFAVKASNLRKILSKLTKLTAKNIYLQGEELHLSLEDESMGMNILKKELCDLGLDTFEIKEIPPTLEDLFSILSSGEAI